MPEGPSGPRGAPRPASLLGRIDYAAVAFVLALCLFAFGYGVAAVKYGLFPSRQIDRALAGIGALGSLEADDLMANALKLDAAAPAAPRVATLDPGAGAEYLLVTGGPYQMMSRCPKFGCMAWIIDRSGRILHSWEVDLDALYAGMPKPAGHARPSNYYPQGLALQADGGLVMALVGFNTFPYQLGIAKVSRDGAILWKRWDHNHHWLTNDGQGNIYAPAMRQLKARQYFGATSVETRCAGSITADSINVYSAAGTPLRRFDLLNVFGDADYPGLFYGLRNGCDPVHLNSIDLASAGVAARVPGVAAGDMLVSLREPNVVALLDGGDGHVKQLVAGRTAAQHSPRFLPDGSVLVLDNQGGRRAQGGSRVVRLDLATGASTTVFPRPGETREVPFYTEDAGHLDISPDGKRAMIVGKEPGRAFEIDVATGRPLWKLSMGMDIAPYLKAQGIESATTRAWFKQWGVYYVTPERFRAAGLGDKPAR